MAFYCTDADVTLWLPSDLTETEIASEAQRSAKLRTPATVWIDAVYPSLVPFADIAASPGTPDMIRQAASYYAAGLGFMVVSKNPEDGDASVMMQMAKNLLQIDEDTGLARARIPGVSTASRMRMVTLARSRYAEGRDNRDAERALE